MTKEKLGLGDKVAKKIQQFAPGYYEKKKNCEPCRKRRALLNKLSK